VCVRACVRVCVCQASPPLKILNWLPHCHETWYELYTIGGNPNCTLHNFLQLSNNNMAESRTCVEGATLATIKDPAAMYSTCLQKHSASLKVIFVVERNVRIRGVYLSCGLSAAATEPLLLGVWHLVRWQTYHLPVRVCSHKHGNDAKLSANIWQI